MEVVRKTIDYENYYNLNIEQRDLKALLNGNIISAKTDNGLGLLIWPSYLHNSRGRFEQDNDVQVENSHNNYILTIDIQKARTVEDIARILTKTGTDKQDSKFGYVILDVNC